MTIAQRFSPDIPVLTIDPFDEAVLRDPEPYYAKLREAGPLVHVEKYGILACGRFKETREIFADWTRFVSSRGVGLSDFKAEKPWRQPSIILEADPPQHSRTRNVMARAMSPHAVARLKDRFSEEAESLIDRLLEKREFDAVRDLAEAFPLKVFPDAVGIASEGRENLLAYGNMVFNAVGPDNPVRREAFANAPAIAAWIAQHCDRNAITSDGFAATIYAAADFRRTDRAGGRTAGSVASFCRRRHDRRRARIGDVLLRDQSGSIRAPSRPSAARATSLRGGPAFHLAGALLLPDRQPDTEVSGLPIPEGGKILCVLGSANLDPEKWPNAGKFEIERKPTGHLAFGTGIHGCVGQSVARQEAEAVLTALSRKVEAIELAADPVWRPGNSIHALDRLPLRITPRP